MQEHKKLEEKIAANKEEHEFNFKSRSKENKHKFTN